MTIDIFADRNGDRSESASGHVRSAGRLRRPLGTFILMVSSLATAGCARQTALPTVSPWPQSRFAFFSCSNTGTPPLARADVYDAFVRAAKKERMKPFVEDSTSGHVVVAGPTAPFFRGTEALRRSRVLLELLVDAEAAEKGETRFFLIEGASMIAPGASLADTLDLRNQASRLSRRWAARAGFPRRGGCWSG